MWPFPNARTERSKFVRSSLDEMNNAHNTTVATLRTIHCSVGLECQFGLLNRSEHREQRNVEYTSYLFLLLMQTILYSVYGEAFGLLFSTMFAC